MTVPTAEAPGLHGFTVVAQNAAGAFDSAEGQLTVASDVALHTQAVHLQLVPVQTTAGQGTPATYKVIVTNTGDTTDTYNLAFAITNASGTLKTRNLALAAPLANFTATFAQPTITVAPGASNARTVLLTLTPQPITNPGSQPFTVSATSTSNHTITSQASSTVNVLSLGVAVSLLKNGQPVNPATNPVLPGDTITMQVKNTGTAKDTFTLSLAGPAALGSTLGATTVSLAAGAKSNLIPITVSAANFATLNEALNLTAIATSRTNAAVKNSANTPVTISNPTVGLTAQFTPDTRIVAPKGTGTFTLQVNNTGNTEYVYTATILSSQNVVNAHLVGLDGQPTQNPVQFHLPGLGIGDLTLQGTVPGTGSGTVTVQVQEYKVQPDGTLALVATAPSVTATILAVTPRPPAPVTVAPFPPGTLYYLYRPTRFGTIAPSRPFFSTNPIFKLPPGGGGGRL